MRRRLLLWWRRWWWALVGAGALFLALFGGRWSRWSLRQRKSHASALRRSYEARIEAEIVKRRLDEDAEAQVRQIRADLEADLGRVKLKQADREAALAADADELVEAYRRRASRLGR